MSDTERYLTVGALREELPFDADDFALQGDVDFDGALERALAAASSMVEAWTDTMFEPTETSDVFAHPDTVPSYDLPLADTPIISIDELDIEDEDELTEGDDYHVHETHIELDPDGELSAWPTDRRSIEVTWTYGHASVPEQVERAIIRLARNALDQIETDGVVTDPDGWTFRPPSDIEAGVAGMLEPYRAPTYNRGVMLI